MISIYRVTTVCLSHSRRVETSLRLFELASFLRLLFVRSKHPVKFRIFMKIPTFNVRSTVRLGLMVLAMVCLAAPQTNRADTTSCCTLNPSPSCPPKDVRSCSVRLEPPTCDTCPCPPGGPGSPSSNNSNPSNPSTPRAGCLPCGRSGVIPMGMPVWWVSEPNCNLRIEDRPWGYQPSHGPAVMFQMSYLQRESFDSGEGIFNLGPNWSFSLRSFVSVVTNDWNQVQVDLHTAGAGLVHYANTNQAQLWKSDVVTMPSSTLTYVDKPDGSREVYGTGYTNGGGQKFLFLSQRLDPAGNALTFNYTYANGGKTIILSTIVDADGLTSLVFYASSPSFSSHIDHLTDPYGRTCYLQYDEIGNLTNVTDVQGLSSGFAYGGYYENYWITNMTTPYGPTAFEFGGVALYGDALFTPDDVEANRYVRITQPDGGHQLYVFQQDCSLFVTNSYLPLPVTSPLTNWFDNVDQSQANSFYWGPLQYAQLSTSAVDSMTRADHALARQRHWLLVQETADEPVPIAVLSNERLPSPDGTTPGQVSWYDYAGKTAANEIGDSAQPLFVAR